jgi:hypothetical protein
MNTASNLPRPGQRVRWRDVRHARALGWLDALGPGPFEVVRVVDHADVGLPPGVVLKTQFGEREINTVWLAPAAGGQPGGEG